MLSITIPAMEIFDEATSMFDTVPEISLTLEHSLVSLSKWESEFEKPFLTPDEKSNEEALGYIRAMTTTEGIPPEAYKRLTNEHISQINAYIEAKMTATWFSDTGKAKRPPSREQVTSELIYFWMSNYQINIEAQHWHLKRLITLIEVHSKKNEPPKKMGKQEMLAQRAKINAERQQRLGTKG